MSAVHVAAVLAAATITLAAVSQQAPARILFIGNSLTFYNEGLWRHLERLASHEAPPRTIVTGRSVFGGAYFKSLWARSEPRQAIHAAPYDVVVLQEDLPETRVDDFREYARHFVTEVRRAGARPVLLMAWAYPRLGWISMSEIAAAHRDAADELNVEVAPAGLAWDRAMEARPALALYASDREHPSLAGTYLTTAVVYATIFAKDPTLVDYAPAGLAPEDAAFLRRVAFATVRAYRGNRPSPGSR